MFILYKGVAKNTPNKSRQSAAPKGSWITPGNPSKAIWDEAPKIVSEPNQVAKRAAVVIESGRDLPARIKSFVFLLSYLQLLQSLE